MAEGTKEVNEFCSWLANQPDKRQTKQKNLRSKREPTLQSKGALGIIKTHKKVYKQGHKYHRMVKK